MNNTAPADVTACFTYGSLMDEDIMSAVAGVRAAPCSATLDGYRRHPVIGAEYPGMVARAGHQVRGVLYLDLPPAAWPRLDRFEGEEYERRIVEVVLADGTVTRAWTYVFRDELASRLGDGDWDFARFLLEGKTRFVSGYPGFDTLPAG
jgi:gamma-glutamylcyclotransferase (GGCT)/AIG2-like uncharacterized protein YtfP